MSEKANRSNSDNNGGFGEEPVDKVDVLRDSFKACMRYYRMQEERQFQNKDPVFLEGACPRKLYPQRVQEVKDSIESKAIDDFKTQLNQYLEAIKSLRLFAGTDHSEQYLECVSILQCCFLMPCEQSSVQKRVEGISDVALKQHLKRVLNSFNR